ncbi:MAG: hypothetical protein ACD_57C00110G0002 [uncultured bacterium]|uniref:Transcriptional regulator MraZ n=1 Tax=Candidatus Woesebacteria bacterium RIFCSPLOWO2_01_FULL_39_21 TaxID=1802519 RepID=A0A1F8BD69_9BACT|nr:MAG: hypothetical protein ACD_57C00110G0002 [uncultured bacterium]OGM22518.1 MAG: hypothetical protein A2691_04605 [Candidatus Woesebacteria bacterium RIFCSPHIGHO2_01_FULL_39_23]OGM61963.1 MAG: hypothetical protein A2961_02770 [Candidatus Woesebacteria bacterium RIFCSPLOWO2_01_FULL_39_21]
MLLGQYQSTIGEKRRVAIPKKFVRELGNKVILAKWYESCLVLVGEERWQEFMGKLTARIDIITSPVRDTERFILGSAYESQPDSQGRIVIPESLSSFAGLKKDVVFLGLGGRVEIWDRLEWMKKEKAISKEASLLLDKLSEVKIKEDRKEV